MLDGKSLGLGPAIINGVNDSIEEHQLRAGLSCFLGRPSFARPREGEAPAEPASQGCRALPEKRTPGRREHDDTS